MTFEKLREYLYKKTLVNRGLNEISATYLAKRGPRYFPDEFNKLIEVSHQGYSEVRTYIDHPEVKNGIFKRTLSDENFKGLCWLTDKRS